MNEEENQVFKILYFYNPEDYGTEELKKYIKIIVNLVEKQQKEIERLKEECIGDTKFDKLLFSIRMLHFHNYVNDKQFAGMIKKLSDENKGE